MKVLVTGVGGGVGQSILKCLNPKKYEVHAADCNPLSAGFHFRNVSKFVALPHSSEKDYIPKLNEYIEKNKISIVLVGGDGELKVLSQKRDKIACKVIISDYNTTMVSLHKRLTSNFCIDNNITHPVLYHKFVPSFPVIVKPEFGWASNDVFTCNNEKELAVIKIYMKSKGIRYIVQKKIEGREITIGAVKTNGKLNGIIMMKREIYKGTSYRVKTITDKRVYDFVKDVCDKYDFEGPCNFQLLDDGKDVYLMEINCRFSGCTYFRSLCGFNDVDQLIDYYTKNKKINFEKIKHRIDRKSVV
jgi:carbamoyl-phosphate synthase large subunit